MPFRSNRWIPSSLPTGQYTSFLLGIHSHRNRDGPCLSGSRALVFRTGIAISDSMKNAGGVAIAAHLGGFAGGFSLTPLLKKEEIKFFSGRLLQTFFSQKYENPIMVHS